MVEITADMYIERVEAGFNRIEAAIRALEDRQRQSEVAQAGFAPQAITRLDAAWRKIDEHSAVMVELQKDLLQLTQSVDQLQGILRWMLGIFTSLIAAMLVALATGHLSISILP